MEWAWLIPVFSFAAALLIVIFGQRLPGKGAFLAILAIAAGFLMFWVVLAGFLDASSSTDKCIISDETGALTCNYERTWFHAGLPGLEDSVELTWGIIIDPLTIAMLGLVTFVALMVQVYSLGYMRGDPRFGLYYAFHALFAASMLTLVLADNFLLLYVAWELVGLCSYLLIGFWHERPAAKEAAKKAFIVTRIGDVGLLVGILLLWREVDSFSMSAAFAAAQGGEMSHGIVTTAAILLFLGAMGKSAQFPFHIWLPDAMEGPTPVSALIHAATMVAAGVYLVARAFPIFEASGDALLVVAIVGLITALIGSTIALVATDLKRILAYSTISHLGLMMLSLGAFGYAAAIFHLMAHGFAKALLFLGAGSVMPQHRGAGCTGHGRPPPGDAPDCLPLLPGRAVPGRDTHPGRLLEQGRNTDCRQRAPQPGVYRPGSSGRLVQCPVHGPGHVPGIFWPVAAAASARPRRPTFHGLADGVAGGAGGGIRAPELQLAG